MSTKEDRNKATMTRFYGLFNEAAFRKKDFSALDAILSPRFVDHNLVPGQGPGIEGLKGAFQSFYDSFSDFSIQIEDIVADGDGVAVRLTFRGTHDGPFMGIPATGKTFAIQGMNFIHLDAEGRPTDRWGNADWMGLMQQLGLAP